jgi:hypothetical protein
VIGGSLRGMCLGRGWGRGRVMGRGDRFGKRRLGSWISSTFKIRTESNL